MKFIDDRRANRKRPLEDSESSTVSENLKLLFEYTKFHIALYAALVGATITLMQVLKDTPVVQCGGTGLKLTVGLWMVSAVAGGTIAGHLPDFRTLQGFRSKYFGPLNIPLLKGSGWEMLEHVSFWLGVACTVITLWVVGAGGGR